MVWKLDRLSRPKVSGQQQSEIRKTITEGDEIAARAARLFKIHPATVSRYWRERVREGQPRPLAQVLHNRFLTVVAQIALSVFNSLPSHDREGTVSALNATNLR